MSQDRTARQIVVTAPGDAAVLALQSSPVGPPAAGEVILRQEAIGLNYHDIYVRSGAYATMPYPGTPGIEAAGVIEEVGAGVQGFSPGQRAAYISGQYGAYADLRAIDAGHLVPLPDDITTQAAAAALLKGVTAHMLLTRLKALRPGDTILVHAAAGGVGQILVQMARSMGLRVLGIVGDDRRAELALAQGCEKVAVRNRDDVLEMVRAATGGHGVQAVFDGIGAATLELSLAALAPFGHCSIFGQVTGRPAPVDVAQLAPRSLSISRPIVFHHVADRAAYRRSAQVLFESLSNGAIRLNEPARYALSQLPEAHIALESGTLPGSIIIIPDEAR